jgi:hypothetical protein
MKIDEGRDWPRRREVMLGEALERIRTMRRGLFLLFHSRKRKILHPYLRGNYFRTILLNRKLLVERPGFFNKLLDCVRNEELLKRETLIKIFCYGVAWGRDRENGEKHRCCDGWKMRFDHEKILFKNKKNTRYKYSKNSVSYLGLDWKSWLD